MTVQPFQRGDDFFGYVVTPFGILPRSKTKTRAVARVSKENQSSYLGYVSHAKSERVAEVMRNMVWMAGA